MAVYYLTSKKTLKLLGVSKYERDTPEVCGWKVKCTASWKLGLGELTWNSWNCRRSPTFWEISLHKQIFSAFKKCHIFSQGCHYKLLQATCSMKKVNIRGTSVLSGYILRFSKYNSYSTSFVLWLASIVIQYLYLLVYILRLKHNRNINLYITNILCSRI